MVEKESSFHRHYKRAYVERLERRQIKKKLMFYSKFAIASILSVRQLEH